MSLCINPKETQIRVAVNGGIIILTVGSASVEQTRRIRKASGTPELKRNKLEWKDDSAEIILQVMDEILIDCGALDADGEITDLTYSDLAGTEASLNNSVDGWKDKICETIKLSAGREFFSVNAEIGGDLIKN
jgi:hypothetical protein